MACVCCLRRSLLFRAASRFWDSFLVCAAGQQIMALSTQQLLCACHIGMDKFQASLGAEPSPWRACSMLHGNDSKLCTGKDLTWELT